MSDDNKSNQIISDKLNMEDSYIINHKQEDLMNYLKEIHCKSEERTFDLNEKFNQIKEELQNLMEEYKIENDNSAQENEEIDFISIKNYINEYISNERNSSINIINDSFEKITSNFEEIVENNNINLEQIENFLNELKNEFEQKMNNAINKNIEISSQKEDINNKLNYQMQEQFDKINRILNEEQQALSDTQIKSIKNIKNLLSNILKYIKREKVQ